MTVQRKCFDDDTNEADDLSVIDRFSLISIGEPLSIP